jgi:hypothetical protein
MGHPAKRRKVSVRRAARLLLSLLVMSSIVPVRCDAQVEDWMIKGTWAALDDSNSEVQVEALIKLENLKSPSPETIQRIKKIFGSNRDQRVRVRALHALGAGGSVMEKSEQGGNEKLFIELMKSEKESREVREAAAEALGEMGVAARDQAPELIEFIKEGSSPVEVRAEAILALGEVLAGTGDAAKEQVQYLLTMSDKDAKLRQASILAVAEIEGPGSTYLDDIVKLFKDPDVSRAAIEAIRYAGAAARDKAADIVKMLEDESKDRENIYAATIETLQKLRGVVQDQIKAIVEIKDKASDPLIRGAAIEALGAVSESNTYTSDFVKLLASSDEATSNAARNALIRMLANGVTFPDEQVQKITMLSSGSDINEPSKQATLESRLNAIELLGLMGRNSFNQLIKLTKESDNDIRAQALRALEQKDWVNRNDAKEVLPVLNDCEPEVCRAAVGALEWMGPLDGDGVLSILNASAKDPAHNAKSRFIAYYLAGDNQEIQTSVRWLGGSDEKVRPDMSAADRIKILTILSKLKPAPGSPVSSELRRRFSEFAQTEDWSKENLKSLREIEQRLRDNQLPEADIFKVRIDEIERRDFVMRWLMTALVVVVSHLLFWLTLIYLYPKYPKVQAIFFWNKWVRRFFGFPYVDFLLIFNPNLRSRLFAPFKKDLKAEAVLSDFDRHPYIEKSYVEHRDASGAGKAVIEPIKHAIPGISGWMILEGESGLGKSMFLRHLVNSSTRLIVYLRAESCADGVIKAIQGKMKGYVADSDFLQSLIFSGAMDVCIDGLNEVSHDTRMKVINFASSFARGGNIILATQPWEWLIPDNAKLYVLQPLAKEQIEEFLFDLEAVLNRDAPVVGVEYENRCRAYLNEALSADQNEELLKEAQNILSNPLELTVLAHLLSNGKNPELIHLIEEHYEVMAKNYEEKNGREFPLRAFSEKLYQMKLKDQVSLPYDDNEFRPAITSMHYHKMVVVKQFEDPSGDKKSLWYFRHDKFMDFFVAKSFEGKGQRFKRHLTDIRFLGVYLLLSRRIFPDDKE